MRDLNVGSKTERVSFRATKAVKKYIEKAATKRGMKLGEYLVYRGLNIDICDYYTEYCYANIINTLNEVEEEYGESDVITEIRRRVRQIWDQ